MTLGDTAFEVAALPGEVAIFPLTGAILLPFGQLPLNIFEPRYVAMIDDAMGQGRMIGMIQPRQTDRETVGDADPIYEIGCLGRISQFAEIPDGRFAVTLSGLCRFHVQRELEMIRGYRRIVPDFTNFLGDLEHSGDSLPDRARLELALRAFFESLEIRADWDAMAQSSDAELVTSMAMGCPFGPEEKQALLEADDLSARAKQLQSILEISLHDGPGSSIRH